jgi:hypothetical protein
MLLTVDAVYFRCQHQGTLDENVGYLLAGMDCQWQGEKRIDSEHMLLIYDIGEFVSR